MKNSMGLLQGPICTDGMDHKKSNLGKSLGTLIGFRALLGSVKMIAIYIFSNAGMAAGLKI